MASANGLWRLYRSRSSSERIRARIWHSTPPGLERCCFGSLGIFGVLGCRVGCLSAFGTSPLRGSFTLAADGDKEEDEDEEDDDEDEDEDEAEEEAAAEPPCKLALVAFLADLGEAPGVGGIDLTKSSCTSMTSKLS